MKMVQNTRRNFQPVITKSVLAIGLFGLILPLSPMLAAPTKANGQIFQLVDGLDSRVSQIEVDLSSSRHVTVDKHGFQPNANVYFVNDTSLGAYARGYTPLRASVRFPDGAAITKLTCFFYDADLDNDLACRLGRTELATGATEFVAELLSEEGTSSEYGDPHIAKAVVLDPEEPVDNINYGYFVEVRPDYNDPIDPYDNDEWGFAGFQNNTPSDPLTFIKGIRIRYRPVESAD